MSKKYTLVFDLDDTLVPNSYRYTIPTLKCATIVSEELKHEAPYSKVLMNEFDELDSSRVKELGFDRRRFPTSWVLYYERCCEKAGIVPSEGVKQRLLHEAARFAEGPFTVYPGTFDALERLRGAGHELHLVTAGDPSLQREKIDQSCVEPHFDGVHIVAVDKKGKLAELVGDDPGSSAMIGDSKRSDIVPAVELGMRAVWVPSQTWDWAHADLHPNDHYVIKSIADLPDLIASWK